VREETRRQRYDSKLKTAKKYPISLCAINFRVDDNLGYLIRTAACFGAEHLYVIGHVPERSKLNSSSGSLVDYVEIIQFTTPSEFLTRMEIEGVKIVAAEVVGEARSFASYSFDFNRRICLVVGNEQSGVPPEIIARSDVIYIDMPGVGYCLNTAQTSNIMLFEAVKQYEEQQRLTLGSD
jgi:tRNA G18 (ribose-2'-O)-methylase SpoU